MEVGGLEKGEWVCFVFYFDHEWGFDFYFESGECLTFLKLSSAKSKS